jgi:hypothetical protein
LGLFFAASMLVFGVSGQHGRHSNPSIAFTIIPAGVSAVLGGIAAAYAVVRQGKRSLLVYPSAPRNQRRRLFDIRS